MNNSQIAASKKAMGLMRLRLPLILGLTLNVLIVGWIPVSQLFLAPRVVAKEAPREEPQPSPVTEETLTPSDPSRPTEAPSDSTTDDNLSRPSATNTDMSVLKPLPVTLAPLLGVADEGAYALAAELSEVPPEPPLDDPQETFASAESLRETPAPVTVEPLEADLVASLTGGSPAPSVTDEATSYIDLFSQDTDTPRLDNLHAPLTLDHQAAATTTQLTAKEVHIRNPMETNGAVHFLVNGEMISLQPGETYQTEMVADALRLRFHRGGSFGNAEEQLTPGVFHFTVSYETGWMLQRGNAPTSPE